jgi:signal transduction histidine kinase
MIGRSLRHRFATIRWKHESYERLHAATFQALNGFLDSLRTLTEVDLIAALTEAHIRAIIACVDSRVVLFGGRADERHIDAAGTTRHSFDLKSATTVFGRIDIVRSGAKPLSVVERDLVHHAAAAASLAICDAQSRTARMEAMDYAAVLLATMPGAVFILDRRFRIERANELGVMLMTADIASLDDCEIIGARPIFAGTDLSEICQDVVATQLPRGLAVASATSANTLDISIAPFRQSVAIFVRDMTHQRETEEKLRQSQKLEAIGQLGGGIAHDVNNMLTVMLGNLDDIAERARMRMLTEGPTSAEEADAGAGASGSRADLLLADAALRAGESATELMSRIVAFARRQPLAPRVVDLAALLASLEGLLRRTLGENIAMRICCGADLWHALVDPTELESAILNLALNARDAMPQCGFMEITASNVDVDRVYAAGSGLSRVGEYIEIGVSDTGRGMPAETMRRAFDPFFTTKEPGKGTGLGLSMVYGFARQSGGHTTIDSEPGAGTIVRIYLPRSYAPVEPARPTGRPQPIGGRETILLVEDNALVRDHTKAMLLGLGYRVSAATDGRDAVAQLDGGLRPDLVLTDVVLPGGMTGRDVADRSARIVAGVRVLFMSGYAGDVLLENGRLEPDVALLKKPYRRAELARRVRLQLEAEPWVRTTRYMTAP